jgi:hypothetical protein
MHGRNAPRPGASVGYKLCIELCIFLTHPTVKTYSRNWLSVYCVNS